MALRRMKTISRPIPFEKVLFLFIVFWNILAIATIQSFDAFVPEMLYTNVLVLALIKGEKAIVFLITIKYQKKA